MAQLLLDNSADISTGDQSDWTPLHIATRYRYEAVARLLLDKGTPVSATTEDSSDVSTTEMNRWTPLHFASVDGYEAIARLLIDKGADISAGDQSNWTPLHLASQNGHVVVAQLLLGNGADVSATNQDGSTPMHLASERDMRRWHGCSWRRAPSSLLPTRKDRNHCTLLPSTDTYLSSCSPTYLLSLHTICI